MSAKDTFHAIVKTALQKDGWLITHDPYPLQAGSFNLANQLYLVIYDIEQEAIERWQP